MFIKKLMMSLKLPNFTVASAEEKFHFFQLRQEKYSLVDPFIFLGQSPLTEAYDLVSSVNYFNGFFFEVVQRKGGYQGYGARNAPIRLAAQLRHNKLKDVA